MGSTVDLIQCNPCWERNTCFFSISISQCAFINCRGRGSYCGDLVHILIQSILGICIHLFECVLHFSKTNLLPVLFMLKIICRKRRILFFHFVPIRLTCLFFGLNYFDFNCQKKKKANIKDPLLLWFWWKGFEELVGMWTNNIKEQKCQSHGRTFTNNSFNHDVCHYKGHKSELSPYSTAFLPPSSKNYS